MDVVENTLKLLEAKLTIKELSKNSEQIQELSLLLQQRSQFYREENARLEGIFKRLNLLNDELKSVLGITNTFNIDQMGNMIKKFEAADLDPNTVSLSQADRLRKHSNYVSKLKICIKLYMNLNQTLSKEIKTSKWDLEQSKGKVGGVLSLSTEEVKQLEEKAKRYENELLKFEKKYPWLKNPAYKLPNISKEIQTLNNLRAEKSKLLKQLSKYQDLKPDLKEASEQLASLKDENQKLVNQLLVKSVVD